jgi:SAM-dependent methyltransferase
MSNVYKGATMSRAGTVEQPRCSTVSEAVKSLSDLIKEQDGGDENYFHGQLGRFSRSVNRILQIRPTPCRVLDIGSHYLHQAGLLSLLGYEVYGLDVEIFTGADFVAERARRLNIRNFSTKTLEHGEFLEGYENYFDLVIFTEAIEHITFNPVGFWRRVYELLTQGGTIYLTTVNSFRPKALLKTILRLTTLTGTGLSVREVLGTITYGHHWKEYSPREIKQYFEALSPDFKVDVRPYSQMPRGGLKRALIGSLSLVPIFRTDIEAIVNIPTKARFSAKVPRLPMHRGKSDLK